MQSIYLKISSVESIHLKISSVESIHLKISSVEAHCYHWRELPQVSFLSQQTHICCDKTSHLSWQKYACCNKTFVATKLCLLWHNIFVMTKTCLSWQAYFCCDKTFCCHDKHVRQNFCHDKSMFVVTNICCDRTILLAAPANDALQLRTSCAGVLHRRSLPTYFKLLYLLNHSVTHPVLLIYTSI